MAIGIAAAASLATLPHAYADGFALRQQSAYGQGLSFAGMAAGGSLSSMFWNPANLADVQGTEIEAVATGILLDVDAKLDPQPLIGFSGSDEGDIARDALLPAGYAAYRLTPRVVLGVGINTPFGLVTKYDSDSILYQTGVAGTTKVSSLNINPAVSVAVTNWLAVAVGAQVQYFDARLTRLALGPLGISTAKGDDVGCGVTAGIRVTPLPGTDIGVGYRSPIKHELDGTLRTENAGIFDVKYKDVDLPGMLTLGVRQKITDRFRAMAGAEWLNWSRFDTVKVEGGPAPIELPFKYDDSWFFSVGGEFDLTPQAEVRAGVGYQLAPIDNPVRTYRLPDNDAAMLSVGASYRLNESISFDVGYGFLAVQHPNLDAAGAGGPDTNGPFSGHANPIVQYVSAALKVNL